MKSQQFLLGVVLSGVFAVTLATRSRSERWAQWKAKHGKSYQNSTHEAQRQAIFETHSDLIDAHNADPTKTFTLAMNEFGDLESQEFRQQRNGFNRHAAAPAPSAPAPATASVTLPASINWTTTGYVTPIKNQGQCGSCWSFSATGAIEALMKNKTGVLPNLSEQNLIDCSKPQGNNGCNGGLMNNAFQYVISNHGIDTEVSYPYTATDTAKCNYKAANSNGNVASFTNVPPNEAALQSAVGLIRPVSVAIDASHQSFQFYSSGVYYEAKCSSTSLDHGVLVVGYGASGGSDYWIVKNSWGTSWGQAGYILMARNRQNNCGIATAASYPL